MMASYAQREAVATLVYLTESADAKHACVQLTVELAAYSCRCHAGVEPSATPTIASNFSRISASISATGTCSTSS